MNAGEDISDRHRRDLPGVARAAELPALHVQVAVGAVAARPAAQHLIVALVNILSRLTDLVGSMELAGPDADVIVQLPHRGDQCTIREAVETLVPWAVGDRVQVLEPGVAKPAIRIAVGADVRPSDQVTTLYGVAGGWRCWIGDFAHAPDAADRWMSENPLGPYLAASLLGGEVFKRARGISRGRLVDDLACSLWTGQTGRWDELGDGPELRGRDLPPLYIIGAGAVGQGLLNLIGAAKFASEYVVTIDDDRHDRTNFNRCFLAGIDDDRHHKVEAVKRFRGFARLAGFEFPGTLADYVSKRRKIGLCDDIAAAEREGKYGIVASCVDKGSSRQDVQGLGPSLIVGGSTLGLAAKANVYNGAAGTPCLGCYNPPEADGARLRRIEQEMRALGRIERRSALEGRVKDIEAVLAYVDSGMRCGMAGEADFRAFATAQTREFSAGFVSMAAAVLMASRLFSQVLFPAGPHASRRKMTSLAFLAGSLEDGALAIDPSCRRCGAIEAEPSAQRSG